MTCLAWAYQVSSGEIKQPLAIQTSQCYSFMWSYLFPFVILYQTNNQLVFKDNIVRSVMFKNPLDKELSIPKVSLLLQFLHLMYFTRFSTVPIPVHLTDIIWIREFCIGLKKLGKLNFLVKKEHRLSTSFNFQIKKSGLVNTICSLNSTTSSLSQLSAVVEVKTPASSIYNGAAAAVYFLLEVKQN